MSLHVTPFLLGMNSGGRCQNDKVKLFFVHYLTQALMCLYHQALHNSSFVSCCFTEVLLFFSGARRQREALEASVSGLDRERPLNIWEHATDEGSLVQPSAHLPPASHQVPVLFYYDRFKERWKQLSQTGTGIAGAQLHIMLEMLWFEKQVLHWWAAVLNSSLLHHLKFWWRQMARSAPEGLWTWWFGPDPEAGVLKKAKLLMSWHF